MEIVLQQKQELTLAMTLELRQAIELLQYSTYELEQYIRQQELENPLIELKEKEENPMYEERVHARSTSFGTSEMPLDVMQKTDHNMRNTLVEQANSMFRDKETQKLLNYLIYNLDDNGYLNNDLSLSEHDIKKGIHLLQEIGPTGIGARTLQECLLLQITYTYPENELAKYLVANHLELLAERKWKEIASCLNISMAEVKNLYDFIQTLSPRPCAFLSDARTEYVTPDIIVERKDGKFVYYLNDGYLPTIQVSTDYSPYLKAKNDLSKYFNDHYKSYQWLLSSIEQRRNTIINIMGVLLEKQRSFFENGFPSLKPLTLKDIAEEIDMHESTISRATANKVIQTPFGSFDLRMLFTSKLETTDGTSISQTKVKTLLQNLISQEDKLKPYSDQKIAEYFNTQQGISISRRTISKYREELRIPPSSKRKDIQV